MFVSSLTNLNSKILETLHTHFTSCIAYTFYTLHLHTLHTHGIQSYTFHNRKGQQELKALIIKKKKKPKGSIGVSHLRRKIKIPVKKFTKPPIPETVGDDEQEDNQSNQGSAKPSLSSNEENDHSGDEPDDEKYQQLEDRMKAMEIQKIPGLDFNDLGLISD